MQGPELERITLVPNEERKSFMANGNIKLSYPVNGVNLNFFANQEKDLTVAKAIEKLQKLDPNDTNVLRHIMSSMVVQDQNERARRYHAKLKQEKMEQDQVNTQPEQTTIDY